MKQLTELETAKCKDWEELGMCFPNILYEVLLCSPDLDEFIEIRGQLSRHVAAWVYWFDMLQDLDEDKKARNYNTILLYEDEAATKQLVVLMLVYRLSEAETLCDLLPCTDEISIIRNIVTLGLSKQMADAGIRV